MGETITISGFRWLTQEGCFTTIKHHILVNSTGITFANMTHDEGRGLFSGFCLTHKPGFGLSLEHLNKGPRPFGEFETLEEAQAACMSHIKKVFEGEENDNTTGNSE